MRNALEIGQDRRDPDGIFSCGWRLARKGGRVKAAGDWYQHKRLESYSGSRIWVMTKSAWLTELVCFEASGERFICTAQLEEALL